MRLAALPRSAGPARRIGSNPATKAPSAASRMRESADGVT